MPSGHVCNQEGKLQVPIPLQVHRDTDCQDQLVQQLLLNALVQQQGYRHANEHVNVTNIRDRQRVVRPT